MGRDKSRLRLGRRTMPGHLRAVAQELDLAVRVIRRDTVPRCGPLGGIYTALQTTRARIVLFLACDMPLVTSALLRAVIRRLRGRRLAVFVTAEGRPGFPCILRREALGVVAAQMGEGRLSLHELARSLKALRYAPPLSWETALRNVNTPEEIAELRRRWERRTPGRKTR